MVRIVRGIRIGRKMQRKIKIMRNGGRMMDGIMRMKRGMQMRETRMQIMEMTLQMTLQMNNLTATRLSTSDPITTSKLKPIKTKKSNPIPKMLLKLTGSKKAPQLTSSSKESVEAVGPTAPSLLLNLTC
jgi:hypothetical protein